MLAVQVALLFRSHDDLLQEFTYFLPDSSVPQVSTKLATAWRKFMAPSIPVSISDLRTPMHMVLALAGSYWSLGKLQKRE